MQSAISSYETEIQDTLFKIEKKIKEINDHGIGSSPLFHRKDSKIRKLNR